MRAGRSLPPGVSLWGRFMWECRRQLPPVCPVCGLDVDKADPFCEEAFDAHHWYSATFYCKGSDVCGVEGGCTWEVTYEALVSRDPLCSMDPVYGPGVERVYL